MTSFITDLQTEVDDEYGPEPILNPTSEPITVNISFQGQDGTLTTRSATVGGNSTVESLIEQVCQQEAGPFFPETISTFYTDDENDFFNPIVDATQTWRVNYHLTVTEQASHWTPPGRDLPVDASSASSENLINVNDSFLKLWTRLTRSPEDYLVRLDPSSNSLEYQGLRVFLKRTLRVPNDRCTHLRPADLGTLPLVNIAQHRDKLPKALHRQSGIFLPLYNSEAMWFAFENDSNLQSRDIALRVYAGGVNCISGVPSHTLQSLIQGLPYYQTGSLPEDQDYIETPGQKFLNGIVTGKNEIRQFVATPLDTRTSIESQIAGRDAIGGLQLEFIPSFSNGCSVVCDDKEIWSSSSSSLDQSTPSAHGLLPGTKLILRGELETSDIALNYTVADMQEFFQQSGSTLDIRVCSYGCKLEGLITVKIREGKEISVQVSNSMTVGMLKDKLKDEIGLPSFDLKFRMMYLESGYLLRYYNITNGCIVHVVTSVTRDDGPPQLMGIGAGGNMDQQLYRDTRDRRIWDLEAATVINFQVLNALDFAQVTGIQPLPTPMTREAYQKQGIPWFKTYEQDLEVLHDAEGPSRFQHLRTLNIETPVGRANVEDITAFTYGRDVYAPIRAGESHVLEVSCVDNFGHSPTPVEAKIPVSWSGFTFHTGNGLNISSPTPHLSSNSSFPSLHISNKDQSPATPSQPELLDSLRNEMTRLSKWIDKFLEACANQLV